MAVKHRQVKSPVLLDVLGNTDGSISGNDDEFREDETLVMKVVTNNRQSVAIVWKQSPWVQMAMNKRPCNASDQNHSVILMIQDER